MGLYAGDPLLFPASYDIPDDGDAEDAASADVGLEALGDRTAYLLTACPGLTAGDSIQLPLFHGMSDPYVGGGGGWPYPVWRRNWAGFEFSIQQASNLSTPHVAMAWDFQIPPKTKVVRVTAILEGAAGHAAFPGGKPGTMPSLTVCLVDNTGVVGALETHTETDTSSTAAIYEAPHGVAANHDFAYDATKRLHILLNGEDGANFIAELACHQIRVYVSPI